MQTKIVVVLWLLLREFIGLYLYNFVSW